MRSRSLVLVLALASALSACGGGESSEPFDVGSPPPGAGGGGAPPPIPPPAPPPTASFDADAHVFARTALFGSFPSDLVLFGDTLFTTDADQIEEKGADIVPLDVSGVAPVPSAAFPTTTIHAASLRTSHGFPADLASPIGFGFYLNDLTVVSESLGFVLANAGGSDSTPALSNLVAFDPSTGALRQVVNLATTYGNGLALVDSAGGVVPGDAFVQSQAEAVEFVPGADGRGQVLVAMANIVVGPPSFGTVRYPGTVQVFDVDPAQPAPVVPRPVGGLATKTVLVGGYNPVALSRISPDPYPHGVRPGDRVLVVVAGATAFDASFRLVPTTDASVEAWDAGTQSLLGSFRLGLAGLAAVRPGLGRDAVGHRVAFLPSATTGEVYLVLLDGLYAADVEPWRLAVLRGPNNGIPIATATPGGPGANVTAAALSPNGRTLVVTGFGDLFSSPPKPGRVYLLSLPQDLVTGSGFGTNFVPGSTLFASVAGRALGRVVLDPRGEGRPEAFVTVSGPIDLTTFLGAGPASVGTLDTDGLIR